MLTPPLLPVYSEHFSLVETMHLNGKMFVFLESALNWVSDILNLEILVRFFD